MKRIKVVGAVIENDRGEILCALRSPAMSMPNLWEFPGGKIEEGETPEETLIREIKEELDCTIHVYDKIEETEHEYPNITVFLSTYRAKVVEGSPRAKEHSLLKWVPLESLHLLPWAAADIPTIDRLNEKHNKAHS